MGKFTVTIMTCDRCDEREEIRLPDQEYAALCSKRTKPITAVIAADDMRLHSGGVG
ncbi:hypothetical protein [Sphingobium baderi]|uniref:hypothetical protein n=1 Tax=Sphingobium baderi TaxID=1332080 RepID=UPI00065D1CD3|nr:hypothetical protein [Sphingobium baderi]KMS62716.1 hypothetical protein V475_06555 [Sphingobium baderi LL03]